MSQSRQALALSIVYSIVLLIWLSARLEYLEWNEVNLQYLLRDFLSGLILLQCFTSALIFIHHSPAICRDDVLALGQLLLFPLPFYSFIWLTGSVSLLVLLKSLFLVGCFSGCVLFILYASRRIPVRLEYTQMSTSLAHVLLCVMLWNFRDRCWDWLQL